MVIHGQGKLKEGSLLKGKMQDAYCRKWLRTRKGYIWVCMGRRKHILMEKEVDKFSSKIECVP